MIAVAVTSQTQPSRFCSYTKSREDFEGKEDYDNYLEGVEDISAFCA